MRKVNGICPMPECGRPIHCKGFCRSHYRKLFENKRRWQIVKNNPTLLENVHRLSKEYRKSDIYKESKKFSDKKYYLANKDKLLLYRRRHRELQRFGTTRSSILNRDGYKCALLDIHPEWNHSPNLIIHHKDGKGRCTDNPDNNPFNLITLCKSCHMKIHGPNGKLIQI